MKRSTLYSNYYADEKTLKAENMLMEKMGMSRKEVREVHTRYGVSAAQLIELMQLNKYQFIYNNKPAGTCRPCFVLSKPLSR